VLNHLTVKHYRNLFEGSWDFSQKIVLIYGENGQGKTNLMDSIHHLCLTKSYFKSLEQQNVSFDQSYFTIQGAFDDGVFFLGWDSAKGKFLRQDGISKTAKEIIGKKPVVMVAPSDTSLINGGGEERRKLMDRLLCQTDLDYLSALTEYQKWLKQRSALLKLVAEGLLNDPTILDFTEHKMVPLAQIIQGKRTELVERMAPRLHEIYSFISDGKEMPALSYQCSVFQTNSEAEKKAGRNLFGPQADDLEWLLDGKSVKKFASQGQQKSFIFSIKLAQIDEITKQSNNPPYLLFDDLFEKLDQPRLIRLMEWVHSKSFAQLFITDTQKERGQKLLGKGIGLVAL